MKNQKGMGQIMLVLCIIIIIAILLGITYLVITKMQEEKRENYETDMLLIQGRTKIISQEANIEKNEEFLKGRKLEENTEEEEIKKLLENNIISKEEENFSKYYILEKQTLEEMGLSNINLEKGYYIVNYETDEIIYSRGIKIGKNTYYKLSELKKLPKETENFGNIEEVNGNNE